MHGAGSIFPIPVTKENLEITRRFVFERWRERAAEIGAPEPQDLSGSCKFSSMFAQAVFGGEIRGNYEHQFVVLEDGTMVDLNEDAADVLALHQKMAAEGPRGWFVPEPTRPWQQVWVGHPHEHDPSWFGCPDHLESMRSCHPRVRHWLASFAQHPELAPQEDASTPGMRL